MPNVIPPLPPDLNTLAILLDVDGTILDLAPTPREVFVPHALRDTLARLWERTGGAVAFVSGRPVSELDLLFSPLRIAGDRRPWRRAAHGRRGVSGSAAAATARPRREAPSLPPSRRPAPASSSRTRAIRSRCITDWRRTRSASCARVAAKICVDLQTSSIELLPGKLVVEIKQTGVTKATAVRELMTYPPFSPAAAPSSSATTSPISACSISCRNYDGIAISVGRKVPGVEGLLRAAGGCPPLAGRYFP